MGPRVSSESSQSDVTLRRIVYQSRAVTPMTDVDLFYLLAQARERNEIADVTGLLLYDRGRFFQWLEGDERDLRPIWNSIRIDQRHRAILLLVDQPCAVRHFVGWDMKFAHRDRQYGMFMRGFVQADGAQLDELHSDSEAVPGILASFSERDGPSASHRLSAMNPDR